jgi:hypothetical protein
VTTNPDPKPEDTTGLEPGGGVPPGETPPAESSGTAAPHSTGPGRKTRSPWLVIALIVVPLLLTALFFLVAGVLRAT